MSAWDQAMQASSGGGGGESGEYGIEATGSQEADAQEVARLIDTLEQFTIQVQRIEALSGLVGTPAEEPGTRADLDILARDAKNTSVELAGLFTTALHNARERGPGARDSDRVRSKLRRDYERQKRSFAELLHSISEKERISSPLVAAAQPPPTPPMGGMLSGITGQRSGGQLQAPLLQSQYHTDQDLEAIIARERGEEIAKLAENVQEINEIYKELGEIVEEQQVGLDDIESHITSARSRVEAGYGEVQQASRMQQSGNKMLLYAACFFITLAVIGILIAYGHEIFK
mmetsp:Transcript_2770/g.8065  ORF Transcript_2770/g.8065 Transcript_2770/m.8065 type:complete len:288 (-) Transcript_2770:73-936(-)|eukprot:CAMPEP_0118887304 /NCGR_PEP_ID=MMETSP1163-20130328/25063_1 /TAXON_ID=124430 /ORGANISM="Phaeomonas parva, Strain CCMP2877" /LENGTH=287 /DNA_ID=CAMNT_0006825711 /DNA_START=179 /DNA_END=1042 /DNA_ORIENTATION=+